MNKHQLCCIGHITLDKVVTPQNTVYMPGGTAFYCSHAIRHFNDIDYALVTAVGATEMNVVEQLREMGIHITALPSKYSVYFENIYGANPDDRTQRVLAKADPFTAGQLKDIDAQIYHLGSLLADDFSLEVIKELSQKGLIAVDSQGYLREVRDTHVYPVDWTDKREALQYIHFLKVNEHEMEVLTGLSDPHEAALCAEDLQHEVRDLVDVVVGMLPAQVVVLDVFPNLFSVFLDHLLRLRARMDR